MEESKCLGCKWFNCTNVNGDNYGFCRSKRNIGLDADCYESEESSNASSKIEAVKQEINDYVNSKSKEEIETEVNETESVFEKLQKYLENATQEQLDKDWEELKQYNEVGPVIVDSCEAVYKWHIISEGDFPTKTEEYLTVCKNKNMENGIYLYEVSYWTGDEWDNRKHYEDIIAWMELPEYEEE